MHISHLKNKLTGKKVVSGLYQLARFSTNSFLIVEEDGLTLIDTGYPGTWRGITKFIASIGRSVQEIKLIIVTHNHLDHIGSLTELVRASGAKVAAHMADILTGDGKIPYHFRDSFWGKVLSLKIMRGIRRTFVLDPNDINVTVLEGQVLPHLGGMQVVHTPGHTHGSISLYFPKQKVFIVGDALNRGGGNLRLPLKSVSLDRDESIRSVQKMTGLDIDILCIGHGDFITANIHEKLLALLERARVDSDA